MYELLHKANATIFGLSGSLPPNCVTKFTRVKILLSHCSEIRRYLSFRGYPVLLLGDILFSFIFYAENFSTTFGAGTVCTCWYLFF